MVLNNKINRRKVFKKLKDRRKNEK